MNKTTGIYWLGSDLRLNDNHCLQKCVDNNANLMFVYCFDPNLLGSGRYNQKRMGIDRRIFLSERLKSLKIELKKRKQELFVFLDDPVKLIPELISHYEVSNVYRSKHPCIDEERQWNKIILDTEKNSDRQINWFHLDNLTLFSEAEIFNIYNFNGKVNQPIGSFSKFRKLIENGIKNNTLSKPILINEPYKLPPTFNFSPNNYISFKKKLVTDIDEILRIKNKEPNNLLKKFIGDENKALRHLNDYFSDLKAHSYKKTRNNLEGWESSTKFSPWLSLGMLSPKQIWNSLINFEFYHKKSDSSYWIFFELLWREYFHFYAKFYKEKLFSFSGINNKKPLTSFYPQRFASWKNSTTPYPLVNACMKELKETGYLSNRGRQLVASCLVNELSIDWRYGAAYFEEQLIDYDPAVNWGNWQYISGVGSDPRSNNGIGRHFNLEKQRQTYDPNMTYTFRWLNKNEINLNSKLDSVDASDWPIA